MLLSPVGDAGTHGWHPSIELVAAGRRPGGCAETCEGLSARAVATTVMDICLVAFTFDSTVPELTRQGRQQSRKGPYGGASSAGFATLMPHSRRIV